MARVMLLLSSAKELKLADGSVIEVGFSPTESVVAYEQLVSAGHDVVVATPDGAVPAVENSDLDPVLHHPADDAHFLAAVTSGFPARADGVRRTLRHLADLDLPAARQLWLAIHAAGIDRADARTRVVRAARVAWLENRNLVSVLVEEGPSCPLDRSRLAGIAAEVAARAREAAELVEVRATSILPFWTPVSLTGIPDSALDAFSALVVPGGRGPMVDLVDNQDVHRLIASLHARSAPIAGLGHGSAFLLSAPATAGGQWMFEGFRMTSATDDEEAQTSFGAAGMPWSVEAALKNAGAVFSAAPSCWEPFVVVDRNLVTAQNPRSAPFLSKAVRQMLEK